MASDRDNLPPTQHLRPSLVKEKLDDEPEIMDAIMEDGTISLSVWKRVKERIKRHGQ